MDSYGTAAGEDVFLGSFTKPTLPNFVATVDLILESGPTEFQYPRRGGFHAVVGGEFGVRHVPTAERLRALGVRCETNISIDVEELFEDHGLALPSFEDDHGADSAAATLVDASTRYGEAFAREHSSVDAMIEFVQEGGQTTRDEMFEAIFVPVAMSVAGRESDARAAVDRYRSGLTKADDRTEYELIMRQLFPSS